MSSVSEETVMPVIAVAAPRFAVRSFQPEKLSAPRFTLPVSVTSASCAPLLSP